MIMDDLILVTHTWSL